jgi:hypothetical protein
MRTELWGVDESGSVAVMNPTTTHLISFRFATLFCFLLTSLTLQSQMLTSPIGTWEVAVKRTRSATKEAGTAYLTFNGDQTLSGYGITTATPGVFTLDGTWTVNASGKVVGNYTEDLNGQSVSGSFIGKARLGRNLQADVVSENGTFKLSGKPPGQIPDFSGSWNGLVTQLRTTVAETYELTPSIDYPGVFEISGDGSGPNGTFSVSGAAILTAKGGVTAFAFSDFEAGGYAVAYVSGKYNAIRHTASLSGLDSRGIRLRAMLSRQ